MWLYSVWFRMYLYVMLFYVHTRIKDVSSAVSVVRRGVGPDPRQDVFDSVDSCNGYGAYYHQPGQCLCDSSKSTFLFEDQKCVQNKDVRLRVLSDCTNIIRFRHGEGEQSPLNVFDLANVSSKKPILNVRGMTGECIVKPQCLNDYDGSLSSKPNAFSININDKTLSWEGSDYYNGRILRLQLENCTATRDSSTFTNPCIALKAKGISIYPPRASSTLSSIGSTTSSKITPSTTYTSGSTSVLSVEYSRISISVSTVRTFGSRSTPTLPHHPPSILSTSASFPSTSFPTPIRCKTYCSQEPTTSIYPLNPTDKNGNRGYQKDEANGTVIGITVVCIIVFVGLFVLVVIMIYRKKSRAHSNGIAEKSSRPRDTVNNPMYGKKGSEVIGLKAKSKPGSHQQEQSDVNNVDYDYAAVDGVQVHTTTNNQPVYQSLDSKNVPQQVYQSLQKENSSRNSGADREQYSYSHLQHPTYEPPHSKDVPSDPVYQPLQRSSGTDDYLEAGTCIDSNQTGASEPVYNVLEGPDPNQHSQDNDPEYNVLEDPNANQHPQDNDPVYNVLEDPNANHAPRDEPLYNVLEDPDGDYDNAPIEDDQDLPVSGQDNIAYSSTIDLNIPQSPRPSSPDYHVLEGPEGSLPDSTYQPLDVLTLDDGVYQPLDRTAQSIYQSLGPKDSTA